MAQVPLVLKVVVFGLCSVAWLVLIYLIAFGEGSN